MRSISGTTQTALNQRQIRVRDFIWLEVRSRVDGTPFSVGYWSDVGSINADVINPRTQATETRLFNGAGSLIAVSPIPLVSNLSVQAVTIDVSQVSNANELIRAYDAKQGKVEVYRGLFEVDSLTQIEPAFPRFFGFIDEVTIQTPAENDMGGISISCVSHTQELMRSNPATRSDAYLRKRSATDSFRRHAAVVGGWDIKWGAVQG